MWHTKCLYQELNRILYNINNEYTQRIVTQNTFTLRIHMYIYSYKWDFYFKSPQPTTNVCKPQSTTAKTSTNCFSQQAGSTKPQKSNRTNDVCKKYMYSVKRRKSSDKTIQPKTRHTHLWKNIQFKSHHKSRSKYEMCNYIRYSTHYAASTRRHKHALLHCIEPRCTDWGPTPNLSSSVSLLWIDWTCRHRSENTS